jgi:hypothetical protein
VNLKSEDPRHPCRRSSSLFQIPKAQNASPLGHMFRGVLVISSERSRGKEDKDDRGAQQQSVREKVPAAGGRQGGAGEGCAGRWRTACSRSPCQKRLRARNPRSRLRSPAKRCIICQVLATTLMFAVVLLCVSLSR